MPQELLSAPGIGLVRNDCRFGFFLPCKFFQVITALWREQTPGRMTARAPSLFLSFLRCPGMPCLARNSKSLLSDKDNEQCPVSSLSREAI